MLLDIQNLEASTGDLKILKGINLKIQKGEIHVIMGVNGSGKSTLSKVLTGHPAYSVDTGKIYFKNEDITALEPEYRAQQGMFLAFQYPVEVPGVTNEEFLRIAYNMKQKLKNLPEVDPLSFFTTLDEKLKFVNLRADFLGRNVNEGFSGGEKKRNEIFQLVTLDSELCILDEIDSGLDIDALRDISTTLNKFIDKNKSLLIITHYKRLLDYIKPDYVHVMRDGKIIRTGDATLADELESKGYEWLVA